MRIRDKYNNILIDAKKLDEYYENLLTKFNKQKFEMMYFLYKQIVQDCSFLCNQTNDSKKIDTMTDVVSASFNAMQDVINVYSNELGDCDGKYPLY